MNVEENSFFLRKAEGFNLIELSSFKSFLGAFLVHGEKTIGTPSQRKERFHRWQSLGNCTGDAHGVTSEPRLRTLSFFMFEGPTGFQSFLPSRSDQSLSRCGGSGNSFFLRGNDCKGCVCNKFSAMILRLCKTYPHHQKHPVEWLPL